MDLYDIFRDDNVRILDLAESLKHVPVDNPEGRLQLAWETQAEVVTHNAAEERVLFPTLLDDPATHDATMAAHHENHAVETLIAEILTLRPTDQHFTHKCQLLAEKLEEHVHRMEAEVYPAAKERLKADDPQELIERALDEKTRVRKRFSPRGEGQPGVSRGGG